MPYTGYDPGGPQDYSGGGLDPSLYYAISQGGRFPGDIQNFLEYLAGQSRGTAGGDPNYEPGKLAEWAANLPGIGGRLLRMLAKGHAANQAGGEGQSPDLPGGYPYHFFSGPGAQFGPPGGPLHGLADQGRTSGDTWDQDRPGGSISTGGGAEKGKSKGGGQSFGKLSLQPYQGLGFKPSFVDWQPTHPFTGSSGPTRFVPGQGSSFPSAKPPANGMPGNGPFGGGGGGGKGPGKGKGKGKGKKGGPVTPGGPNAGGPGTGTGSPLDELLALLFPNSMPGGRGDPQRFGAPGPGMRAGAGSGINPNNLDMGTPGWMKDPTQSGGFPNPTPFAPNPGESIDSYMTRLHDAGFGTQDILSMVGPGGFRQGADGSWDWDWGTGNPVRTPSGYQFANQAGTPGITADWGNLGTGQGVFGLGEAGPEQGQGNIPWFYEGPGGQGAFGVPGLGGGAGAGAAGPSGIATGAPRNWNATAGDWILGGVTGAPSY